MAERARLLRTNDELVRSVATWARSNPNLTSNSSPKPTGRPPCTPARTMYPTTTYRLHLHEDLHSGAQGEVQRSYSPEDSQRQDHHSNGPQLRARAMAEQLLRPAAKALFLQVFGSLTWARARNKFDIAYALSRNNL